MVDTAVPATELTGGYLCKYFITFIVFIQNCEKLKLERGKNNILDMYRNIFSYVRKCIVRQIQSNNNTKKYKKILLSLLERFRRLSAIFLEFPFAVA